MSVTFDENIGTLTPGILDDFDRYRMAGTFYAIGEQAEEHPAQSRHIVKRGHELGNHSYAHTDMTAKPDSGRSSMRRANRAIREVTGFRPCTFRPPYLPMRPSCMRLAVSTCARCSRPVVTTSSVSP